MCKSDEENIVFQPFEKVYIPVDAAITLKSLQQRWPSVSYDIFIDNIEMDFLSGFPRPFGTLQQVKDPQSGEIFYDCEYVPPGIQIRESPKQHIVLGYTPSWQLHQEEERQTRLKKWTLGFIYLLSQVEQYELENPFLRFTVVGSDISCSVSPHDESSSTGDTITQDEQDTNNAVASANIEAWRKTIPYLNKAERVVANVVIAKWEGKSHLETFKEIFPNDKISNPKIRISRMRNQAKIIAQEYHLQMPNWKTSKN